MVSDDKYPKWTGWHAVLVLAAVFVLLWPAKLLPGFFTRVFCQSMVMAFLVLFLVRRSGASLTELGLHRQNLRKNALTGFLGGLVLFFLVTFLTVLLIYLTGRIPVPQEVARQLAGTPPGRLIWPAVVVMIAAPVAEELYFRGMVYPLLRSRVGVDAAVLISALFFSALHFSIFGLAPIAIAGAVLALLYQKTGSLIAPIIAHGTWNGVTIIFTLFGR